MTVTLQPAASLLLIVRDEPLDRLERLLDGLAAQRGVGALELLIGAPVSEHDRLGTLCTSGVVGRVVLVDNPTGARSAGLNRLVEVATAPVVVRVDARSRPPEDYVARCLARLDAAPGIGVVGAIQRPATARPDVRSRGITRALGNPWLLGGARYRRSGGGGPADTAYLGAFRRDELRVLGGYDERLDANEDFELCARYRSAGAAVWVEPGLEVAYEPRQTYRSLWRQYRAFGMSKVVFWRLTGRAPNARQTAALGGAAATAAIGVVTLVRRPASSVALIAAGVATVVIVDHVAAPAERDVRVRVAAGAAYVTVIGAWISGIARALVRVR
ncbi:MAG: glycosyltransferase [Acidimicrobiia bacterium]|nr:glycosyltransferase [Acidimicrobiia bacterium]